jgi:phosphohistidine phosphatase SixA
MSPQTLHRLAPHHNYLTGDQHITMHRTGAASQVPTAAAQQGVDDHKVSASTAARCQQTSHTSAATATGNKQ